MYFDEKKAADIRGDKKIDETVSLILKFFIENLHFFKILVIIRLTFYIQVCKVKFIYKE